MMKKTAIFLAVIGSALAAPAVVWKSGDRGGTTPLRTSKTLRASDLLTDVLSLDVSSSPLASVVFVLGRGHDGSESLSTMAAAGDLPSVEKKYNSADAIHHHVAGVESPSSLEKDATRAGGAGHKVLSITLGELNSRLTARSEAQEIEISQNGVMSKVAKQNHKRAQDLSDATVLIVTVDPRTDDKSALDAAIVSAIEHEAVSSVVLTAVRSHDEVKQERLMEHNRRLALMKKAGGGTATKMHGRRLEDQEQEDQDGNNDNANQNANNQDDMTGVYYVSMTPNILAGILFTLLFTVTTWIGVTCMGMIAGQDVYVKKLPPVGREA